MPSAELVLIDTSVWIDYFSGRTAALTRTLDLLLDNGTIATAAIVLAELAQGAKSERETNTIRSHFRPLAWIASTDAHWEVAGQMSAKLRRAGKNVNLTDCYIAALAQTAQARVWSLDKHFSWLAGSGACRLYVVE